ncbi:MAG: hypothetical protein AAB544_02325 [Patescibacteria group bacterium]
MKRHLSRMQHLLVLQMALAVTLASGSILAASVGETTPEEPMPGEAADDPAMDTRREKIEDFKSEYLMSRKAVESTFTMEATLRQEHAELRRDCREMLRKANRDQSLPRLSDCMKDDLQRTLEMVTARGTSIAATAGVSSDVKKLIAARNELLRDALDTIITALDAGVYTDEEGLFEARDNLREKYFKPYTVLLPQLQAGHALSWISHLLVRADSLKKSGTLSEQVLGKVVEAETCLLIEEDSLSQAMESNEIISTISQSLDRLPDCLDLLTQAQVLWNQEQTPEAESTSEPQWENRKIRRLPSTRN